MTCDDSMDRWPKSKNSSKVEQREWEALQALARESNQSISGMLSEKVAEYVASKRLRPEVMDHLEASMDENEELGRLLAQ